MLAAEIVGHAVAGRTAVMGGLDKNQARRLSSVCQQKAQEWREKQRIRQMEEDRARAGGIVMHAQGGGQAAPALEDPVERLAKAKRMLVQQLIAEAAYETLKAKILAEI
jgi:hypothetical protein